MVWSVHTIITYRFIAAYQNIRIIMEWFPLHRYRRTLNCHATAQYGGTGGSYFQDACHSAITKIEIWSHVPQSQAELIRGIQITYRDALNRDYIGTRHGLNEGTHHVVHLAEGEQIIAVVGRATTNGQRGRVKQLAFLTRGSGGVRNVFGPYGPASGTLFLVNANVVSIFGRSCASIDALGFFYTA